MYRGAWGRAEFQHLETPGSFGLWDTVAMPEWYLGLLCLLGLSLLGLSWPPLLGAVPLLLVGAGLTLVRSLRAAARARYPDEPRGGLEWLRRFGLVTVLHLIQPAARLTGRLLAGLSPWRVRAIVRDFPRPRGRRIALWREHGEPADDTLRRVEQRLVEAGSAVRRGDGYADWDLQVDGGNFGFARLRTCVEEHGRGRQLMRAQIQPRMSVLGLVGSVTGLIAALGASADGGTAAATVLGFTTLVVLLRSLTECSSAVAALSEAVMDAERASSPLAPSESLRWSVVATGSATPTTTTAPTG